MNGFDALIRQYNAHNGNTVPDSRWAVGKWEPLPWFHPTHIHKDIFGRVVAPGLPRIRLTARTSTRFAEVTL